MHSSEMRNTKDFLIRASNSTKNSYKEYDWHLFSSFDSQWAKCSNVQSTQTTHVCKAHVDSFHTAIN